MAQGYYAINGQRDAFSERIYFDFEDYRKRRKARNGKRSSHAPRTSVWDRLREVYVCHMSFRVYPLLVECAFTVLVQFVFIWVELLLQLKDNRNCQRSFVFCKIAHASDSELQ